MKTIFIFILTITHISLFACLNEHHVSKLGKQSIDHFSMLDIRFETFFEKAAIEEHIRILLTQNPTKEDDILSTQNSLAVNYIKLVKLSEAEKILNALYKKHPKDYSVIINLGTLYELQGKNEKALEYIKKAIAINPDSHAESEWFHVKVLEFKIKNIAANNIRSTNILRIKEAQNKLANSLAFEIGYQLKERIPFTPIPNLMMAKILEEYGDLLADSVSIKGAYVIYEIGMNYDKNNSLNLAKKRDDLLPYFKKYKEAVPITKNYYIDEIANEINNNRNEVVNSILDNSLNYLKKEQSKKEKKETRQSTITKIITISIIILLAIIALVFFLKRK